MGGAVSVGGSGVVFLDLACVNRFLAGCGIVSPDLEASVRPFPAAKVPVQSVVLSLNSLAAPRPVPLPRASRLALASALGPSTSFLRTAFPNDMEVSGPCFLGSSPLRCQPQGTLRFTDPPPSLL